MSYTYLQEREGGFLEECFSDIPQFALSKLNHTAGKYCSKDNETESCHDSPSGTTFKPLTETHGEGALTSLRADFHAKTSVQPEKGPELKASDLECGWKWHGSFVKWDRATSSWKTGQCSLLAGLDEFSETWPRWGMMRDGECSELVTPERNMSETESGFLPTPTSHNAKEGNYPSEHRRNTPLLATHAGGKINPEWTEWLMGWPIKWTDLQPLEMAKFQSWMCSHGKHLEGVNCE